MKHTFVIFAVIAVMSLSTGILYADETNDSETLKAGIEQTVLPKSFLYNRAVLERYNKYRKKLLDLLELTKRVKDFINNETTVDKSPDLQRLSALSNAAQREFDALNRQLDDDERQYRSFGMLQLFSKNLIDISNYWQITTKTRLSRPLQTQMNLDIQNWGISRNKILETISQIETWEATEAIITADPDQF